MARVLAFALLVVSLTQADARRVVTDSTAIATDEVTNEELCADVITDQTCFEMNGGEKHERGDDWTQSTQIRDLLAADDDSMIRFWDAVGASTAHPTTDGQGHWIQCKELCNAVVQYAQREGVCPAASDLACFIEPGQEPDCTLDVGIHTLPTLGPDANTDMPDLHDKDIMDNASDSLLQASALIGETVKAGVKTDIIDYDTWEMVERVANLFRVYPARKPSTDAEDGNSLMEASGHAFPIGKARVHAQKEAEAKAYMGVVIRAFNAKRTSSQMTKWFGRSAYSSPSTRREVLRVLNSVDHMISNIEPMYPGPKCSERTYAYVYPKAYTCSRSSEMSRRACTKLGRKFVFYLCPLYLARPREMIETLVHEGSHHATSYTDDVKFNGGTAYGRSTCMALARTDSAKAIKNADNFCYYIQDVATQVSDTSGGGRTLSTTSRCGDGRYADSDGDCKCSVLKTCYENGHRGCTSSMGRRSIMYYALSCSSCKCQ